LSSTTRSRSIMRYRYLSSSIKFAFVSPYVVLNVPVLLRKFRVCWIAERCVASSWLSFEWATQPPVVSVLLPIPLHTCRQMAVSQFVVWWGYSPGDKGYKLRTSGGGSRWGLSKRSAANKRRSETLYSEEDHYIINPRDKHVNPYTVPAWGLKTGRAGRTIKQLALWRHSWITVALRFLEQEYQEFTVRLRIST
jgi:hypothetical protein